MSTLETNLAAQPSGATPTIASIIDGEARTDAPGGAPDLHQSRPHSTRSSPRSLLADAGDVRRRLPRRARRAGASGRSVPAPVRGRVIAQVGRLVEANKEALAAPRHARDRQAVRRVARRGAGDHRHLRLLPRRGPPALRPDRAVGDARQAAVHVPHAGRRGGDHHRRQLPGRRARVVPRAGDPVRQRGRLEAGRVLAPRSATRWPQLFHAGGVPGGVLNLVQADGRGRRSRASSARSRRASSTRSASPARAPSAPRSASSAGATCSRRASSSAARTRWS